MWKKIMVDEVKEKITRHQQVLMQLLETYAALLKPSNWLDVDNQVIADFERNHFLLVSVGWNKGVFRHSIIFHFDIKPDGKIWLIANWTDVLIAEELLTMGIERMDIVVGFQPEELRPYSGFAVA